MFNRVLDGSEGRINRFYPFDRVVDDAAMLQGCALMQVA